MAQDLSEMLGQVMEDPQFAAMVQKLRQQMGNTEPPDLASLLEKLPAMMTMLSGMGQAAGGNTTETKEAKADASVSGTAPDLSAPDSSAPDSSGGEKEKAETEGPAVLGQVLFRPEARDQRNKLLSALKPYLSPNRCAMIDRAMSAMQLGELLGTMGKLPPTTQA